MYVKLSNVEIFSYFAIWIGAVLYSFYNVYHSGKVLEEHLTEYSYFEYHWTKLFISRKRDYSDYEWDRCTYYMKFVLLYLVANAALTEVLRQLKQFTFIPLTHLLITVLLIYNEFGAVTLAYLFIQPILFQLSSKLNNKFAVWACALVNYALHYKFIDYVEDTEIIVPGIFWIKLRCLSYFLDRVNQKKGKESFLEFLGYCFYQPVLILGPFVSFEDYKKSYGLSTAFTKRLLKFIGNSIRFLFWFAVIEVSFHYFYTHYISMHAFFVNSMDNWTLYGFGYTMGQFFHVKYVVFYGLSTTWAALEGIPVPNTPKCIGRIHLYSDMWKYFDVGLHRFLVKYLYIPTNGAKTTFSKVLASAVCFCFIFGWHGLHGNILIWSVLNLIGVLTEYIASDVYNRFLKKTFDEHFSTQWQRRIFCGVASPLLALSAISNFYYFSNEAVGHVFMRRYAYGGIIPNFILLFVMYCTCQISTEIRHWERRNKNKDIVSKCK